MCGRCRFNLRPDDLPRACHLDGRPVRHLEIDRYRQSYNVSPGSYLPVVRRDVGSDVQAAVIQCMKWGLVPSFTKKTDKLDHYKMFNARCESIFEKASFRRLVPNNRCLVAVEGFYEWKKDASKKQPYYIHFKDGRPLVFAALYDSWKNSEGDVLYTFTILTTSSSSALAWLHDRMPVILGDKASTDIWLNGSSSSKFDTLLKPYEESDLAWYPVTPAMGKISFDGPECIREIQLKTEEMKPIWNFFVRKARNNDQELKPRLGKESVEANEPRSLKVEPETEDNPDHQCCTGKSNHDSKSNVSTVTCDTLTGFQAKQEYEEFSADAMPSVNESDEQFAGSASKKMKIGDPGHKQPTLFSYFGKR